MQTNRRMRPETGQSVHWMRCRTVRSLACFVGMSWQADPINSQIILSAVEVIYEQLSVLQLNSILISIMLKKESSGTLWHWLRVKHFNGFAVGGFLSFLHINNFVNILLQLKSISNSNGTALQKNYWEWSAMLMFFFICCFSRFILL